MEDRMPSFLNKFTIYGFILAAILGMFGSAVHMWVNTIKQEAQLEFNNKQIQLVLDQQKQFMDNMQKVNEDQKTAIQDLNTQNTELESHINDIQSYLASEQAQKDSRPSSPVIKNTIKKMSDGQ
jgi:predicted membrane protein